MLDRRTEEVACKGGPAAAGGPSLEAGCCWLLGTGAASPSRERDEFPKALPLRALFHASQEQRTRGGQVPLLPVPSCQCGEQQAELSLAAQSLPTPLLSNQ